MADAPALQALHEGASGRGGTPLAPRKRMTRNRRYPPIADYALIGDCHTAALISKSGSIDWCCLPRFDSDSCFGRMLDWQKGGYCAISPIERCTVGREYLPGTLILVTTFARGRNAARVIDFFAMRKGGRRRPRRRLVRIVEGVRGTMRLAVDVVARLDYGEVKPWIYRAGEALHAAAGSNKGLLIFGDIALDLVGEHDLHAEVEIRTKARKRLAIQFVAPEDLDGIASKACTVGELDRHLDETTRWWRHWSDKIRYAEHPGARATRGEGIVLPERQRPRPQRPRTTADVLRSAIVLKALNYAPTGAIIAAPTTSLPEDLGGVRNWDYRFSWLRDSIFTVHALADLGCESEADGFRRFIQRSAAGNADELQIMYGVDGKRRLTEVVLEHLEGWRKSVPVRIGNAADKQFQSDMFGLILELAWRWSQRGNAPEPHYWEFLVELVEATIAKWRLPDRGIWEVRTAPRHFVHSKVMCWAAVHRGITLAQAHSLAAPIERWQKARDAIRAAIETRGYDARRGIFVASFGARDLDAALLLLPEVEFVDYRDVRMMRTVDAIQRELGSGGLVRRYRTDGHPLGNEGVFLPCSFWLAECLARQGRLDQARKVYDRAAKCANELGLFSEEYAPQSRQMLGNFPQGLTHLAHISAALALRGGGPPTRA